MTRFRAFFSDWPLFLYNCVLLLAAPIILPLKAWRYWKKGWKREYDLRRWAIPHPRAWNESTSSIKSTSGKSTSDTPHVVIIATGWGEMRLAALLDGQLKAEDSTVRTTWVLRDAEAARAAQREYPEQKISFLPFDFLLPVLSWLRRLQPDTVVFIEKFWFPNMVRCCHNWGAKLVVINARTRAHDSMRYQILEPFHRWIGSSFEQFVFQSEADLQRASKVLSRQTKVSAPGNLKFSLRPSLSEESKESLAAWLSDGTSAPLLSAGSLEEGDLSFVLDAFDGVRKQFPCRLLIAPRRLHTAAEMKKEVQERGYRVSLRSQQSTSEVGRSGENDIYLLDSMGELATAYQFSQAAFIGGTIKRGAGHNIVEPLVFGVPVSYGPNRGFFESVQRACEAESVGFRVQNSAELAAHWSALLVDESMLREIADRARRLLDRQNAVLSANVAAILNSLNSETTRF